MIQHQVLLSECFRLLQIGNNIKVISTSEIKISVLIDKKNINRALISLHKEFKLDRQK